MLIEKILHWLQHPTLFKIMGSRISGINEAILGLKNTGVPLVGFNGLQYSASGFGDDVGIFYLVPKLAVWFGWNAERALFVFWNGAIVLALFMGTLGIFMLFSSSRARLYAGMGMLLSAAVAYISWDVYAAAFVAPMMTLFIFLALVRNKLADDGSLPFFIAFGFVLGVFNQIRIHSGDAVILFMFLVLLGAPEIPGWKRLFSIILLAVGFGGTTLFFKHAITVRDAFLLSHNATPMEAATLAHPVWHQIFIGFGYLKNDFGLQYLDEIGLAFAQKVSPQVVFLSTEYEKIMKTLTLDFIHQHPVFVIKTVLAKIFAVAVFFVMFANAGILAWLRNAPHRFIQIAFLVCLGYTALSGILTIPSPKYLLGFLTFAAVWGSYENGTRLDREKSS